MDEQHIAGWPLGAGTQKQLAERLQAASDSSRCEIIACWCPETGFALAVHVADGKAFFFECVGPLTKTQADTWAAGINADDTGSARVVM